MTHSLSMRGVLLAALVGASCTTTVTRRLPLMLTDQPADTRACYEKCRGLDVAEAEAFRACVSKCPGVQVSVEEQPCGPNDKPPVAVCFTEAETDTAASMLLFFAVAVGLGAALVGTKH